MKDKENTIAANKEIPEDDLASVTGGIIKHVKTAVCMHCGRPIRTLELVGSIIECPECGKKTEVRPII